MEINQPVLLPASVDLRQVVANVHVLKIVRHTNFEESWLVMAWQTVTNIDWDDLASRDPVRYVRFDTQSCVGFRLDRNVPCLPTLFAPNRSDVDVYVLEYYNTSPGRPTTGPDVSSVVEAAASGPPVSSQLVVSYAVRSALCLLPSLM